MFLCLDSSTWALSIVSWYTASFSRFNSQSMRWQPYMIPVAVARSSTDGNAISYVYSPFLWKTFCFHIMGRICQNLRPRVCFVELPGGSTGGEVFRLRQRCVAGATVIEGFGGRLSLSCKVEQPRRIDGTVIMNSGSSRAAGWGRVTHWPIFVCL